MTAKLLGVQALEMYEKMIRKEFDPIVSTLEARGNSIRADVVRQVKMSFGLYDLEAKIKTVEIELKELEAERDSFITVGHQYRNSETDFTSDSIVGKEVSRMMDQLNSPLADVKEKRDRTIKQLRLAGLPEEIQNVFKELENTVLRLADDIKKLPPINKGLKRIKRKK